jgi:hypothetical protein
MCDSGFSAESVLPLVLVRIAIDSAQQTQSRAARQQWLMQGSSSERADVMANGKLQLTD